MFFIDSHCHIHDEDFPINQSEVFTLMQENKIQKAICVGVSIENSIRAVDYSFANDTKEYNIELYSAIGVHPHEAKNLSMEGILKLEEQLQKHKEKIVAIGEIGLDYFYNNSDRNSQIKALELQLELAKKYDLPVIFHIRNAFDDFWQVLDQFEVKNNYKIRGVVHSFTDNEENLQKALDHGFYIGVNGISTFVKKPEELAMFSQIPLEKMLLETDAPFLAPQDKRGKKNQPAYIKLIAEDLAKKRNTAIEEIAKVTTKNSQLLFNI